MREFTQEREKERERERERERESFNYQWSINSHLFPRCIMHALIRARDKKKNSASLNDHRIKIFVHHRYLRTRLGWTSTFSGMDSEINTLRLRSYLIINWRNFRILFALSLCIHISDDIERPDDFVKYRAFNESRAHRSAAGGITDAVR